MQTKFITIKNPVGLHLKPANMLANKTRRYVSQVYLSKGASRINAKSVLGILGMGVYQGDDIILECFGEDEERAIEEIARFIEEEIID